MANIDCPCVGEAERIVSRLGLERGAVSFLDIRHDNWCPIVGGDGHAPCRPEYWLNGRNVTGAAHDDA